MTDGGPRFEDTMAELEALREETEARFRELLDQLTGQVEAVRAAGDRSTQLCEAQMGARREALESVKAGLSDVAAADQLAWPSGGGLLRGLVNAVSRWALRDYLEVLDRRGDTRLRRVDDLKDRVDRLQHTVSAGSETFAALNEALGAAHLALQSALATHARMLDLVNAKDAEVLQRAVAGPLRRMEVLFDEFGRQQEAMLSQLVGRRQELDQLVERVVAEGEPRQH